MSKNHQSESHLSKDEQEFAKNVHDSFQKLEESISVSTPDEQWFQQMIIEQKVEVRRKWRNEWLLFLGVASLILLMFFTTLMQKPVAFIILQVLAGVLLIGYTFGQIQKHRERVRHE